MKSATPTADAPGIWRYTAVEIGQPPGGRNGRTASGGGGGGGGRRVGELAGASASEVRASLRRIGLQVIELRPIQPRRASRQRSEGAHARSGDLLRGRLQRHLRTRRREQRAELFDGLSTMLESGLPLLEAVETLIAAPESGGAGSRRFILARWLPLRSTFRGRGRTMLIELREALRGGASLDEAMSVHPSWFDETEVAMMRAAQHAGNLPPVLRRLAEQHERAGQLGHKLASALAYPSVIAIVGVGVAMFLSMKTLPDLSRILTSAGLEIPALTQFVMTSGQFIARWWPALLILAAVVVLGGWAAPALAERFMPGQRRLLLAPKVVRRIAVAGFSMRLAELLRTGVPVVEAIRVLAPTISNASFRGLLRSAAERVERGEDLSDALDDSRWFEGEYRRLLEIGQASGELDTLLERIGKRYERTAARLIDRLSSLLEPCVILALAVLIGVVVMAAVLPLTRLQEVLR